MSVAILMKATMSRKLALIDYTERVEIVLCDDGWAEYEEHVYGF